VGRVLEDYFDLPPVILCYKLNGEWLDAERGGPVRVVVPEAYGFKSVKWITHIVLTNLAHSNDTYANGNNDLDSPLKSFAATLSVPSTVKVGAPIPITGYAQVGISGVSKVQVWLQREGETGQAKPPGFAEAPWIDATILTRPKLWGALSDEKLLRGSHGFTAEGEPKSWPMRLAKVHWAVLLPPAELGNYVLRSRTVDEKGHGQPMPRPFRKSGHAALEAVKIAVK
jgi:DMSO/TMAO reductase YedYZ molybdopterin-dependent catalytic subunit